MRRPYFSILMCAYNSEETIEDAICSCLGQEFADWELLILDNNSPDESMQIAQKYEKKDKRIRLFHSDENIGWAKGTSILLKEASGVYMTFLAADDYFASRYALSLVAEFTQGEGKEPPIVFVKHQITTRNDEKINREKEELEAIDMHYDNALAALSWLTNNWYYNSMFHFCNIRLLRENGIDLYKPFHADNEGMTKAVLCADRFGCIQNDIYVLTTDTSQTTGIVAFEYKAELNRWDYVKEYMLQHGIHDEESLHDIAVYFGKLAYGRLGCVCDGGRIVDRHMNPVPCSAWEKFQFIQSILSSDELNELHYYDEMRAYILGFIIKCVRFFYENKSELERNATKNDWLYSFLESGFEIHDGEVVKKSRLKDDGITRAFEALVSEENPYCYGFSLFADLMTDFSDEMLVQIYQHYEKGRKRIMDSFDENHISMEIVG